MEQLLFQHIHNVSCFVGTRLLFVVRQYCNYIELWTGKLFGEGPRGLLMR